MGSHLGRASAHVEAAGVLTGKFLDRSVPQVDAGMLKEQVAKGRAGEICVLMRIINEIMWLCRIVG